MYILTNFSYNISNLNRVVNAGAQWREMADLMLIPNLCQKALKNGRVSRPLQHDVMCDYQILLNQLLSFSTSKEIFLFSQPLVFKITYSSPVLKL
jgi:hypothetical protein